MHTVEVSLSSMLLSALFKEYLRSDELHFENYLESISSRVAYNPNKGYTLFFEQERERTLFCLKWS